MQREGGEEGKGESRAHQIEAQQDESRHWKRARHQERHKDTGPLRYTAKLHLTYPDNLTEACTHPLHELII